MFLCVTNRCYERFEKKTFGKWEVIEFSYYNKNKKRNIWLCRCECGNEKKIREDTLTGGASKSCGCVNRHCNINNRRWKGFGEISATFWNKVRRGAERRKIEFSLKIEDMWDLFLEQKKKCALSDVELSFSKRIKDYDGNASIDRIDSSKGYIKGNVQWVDKKVNFMKITLSQENFIAICKLVAIKNNPLPIKEGG
jgi:hypothetical protein